jgi:hypothetical protein
MSQVNAPAYYRPYESEDEQEKEDEEEEASLSDSDGSSHSSGSGSDSDSDDGGERDLVRDAFADTIARGLDDPRYAIIRAAGPSLNTVDEQMRYEKPRFGREIEGAEYTGWSAIQANSNVLLQPGQSLGVSPLYLNPKKRIQSTLFSFKSADRDREVYPLSSFFSLKTPRPYKNITQIQLVQLSFRYFVNAVPDVSGNALVVIAEILSTAGYDISDCASCLPISTNITGIGFSEVGRSNPVQPGAPLTHIAPVRPGNYDINGLLQELDQQTNKTPPFSLVSYAEHYTQFKATKRVDHLFNEPGRYYHKKLSGVFVPSPAKADIVADYFPHTDIANSAAPSDQEIFVAYFYPVLREAFLSPLDHKFLDLLTYSEAEVRTRVVQHYEGLSSTFYYDLCKANVDYLRKLRRAHTFEYNPINEYRWEHNPYTNRVSIRFTDLHSSLKKELAGRHSLHKQQAVANAGYTLGQYTTLETQLQKTKGIVTDLTRQLQTALTEVGVPFGVYGADYLDVSSYGISTTNKIFLGGGLLGASDDLLIGVATGSVSVPSVTPAVRPSPLDFGEMQIGELVTESLGVSGGVVDPGYTTAWWQHLSSLNAYSQVSRVGSNYVAGYGGVDVSATDFVSLYSTFQSYYAQNVSTAAAVGSVVSAQYSATSNYVHGRYGGVFPPALLSNNAFLTGVGTGGMTLLAGQKLVRASTPFDGVGTGTTPCCQALFQIARNLYSCIPAEYVANSIFYKLGYPPADVLAYFSTSGLFGALTQGNIYLQLNVDRSLNNMDVARIENYRISNETAGEYKVVLGKMLTEGSGLADVTQTIIQSPARFEAPLASIDNFTFTLLLDDLQPLAKAFPFDIPSTDWDAVLQIDEEVGTLDRDTQLTSIPTVVWPENKRPF